jgi:hypothetical protein
MVRLFAEKLRPIGVGDLGHVDVAAGIDRDGVRRDELAWSRGAVAGCRWRCRKEDPRIDWAVTRRGTCGAQNGRPWALRLTIASLGLSWSSRRLSGAAPLGFPTDSLQTLLADLAALARHTVTTTTAMSPAQEFAVHWHPTALQRKALELPGINHTTCTQYSPGLAKMLSRITRLPIEMGEAQSREAQSLTRRFTVSLLRRATKG